jgi:preprotein translocase subunit YajC
MFLAAAAAKKGSSSEELLIFVVLIFGALYFLMIRPQRARQRRSVQMQSTVIPGQRIRTTAGIYGTIVSADDHDVVVQIAPGVEVRMLRRAVMDVIPDDDPADGGQAPPESHPDDSPADDWDTGDRNV